MAAESIAAHIDVVAESRAAVEKRFRDLLDANAPALARLAASYARSASDRDDLLQEIAMALWQALPRFRGECSERTFLFRIAHNRCLAHLSRRRPTLPLDGQEIGVADPASSTEQRLSSDQQRDRLVKAVRSLPPIYRQVVTLTLEGLAYKEIAEVLGISESNVGVRLNRGRQLLKSLLEERS
jgi:RNA polymerase sigma-70 factor (ECF subfamily)